jgi:NAD(P)-dependent dehydrogenase (short-subunit alcohol dehydrogenase family)
MDDWLGLSGKRAIVVGAGGFGVSCTEALVRQGAAVYLADRDADRLRTVENDTVLRGVWDVREEHACEELVATGIEQLGGLDIFIHAVGINDRRPILDIGADCWQAILDVNLTSGFNLGRAAGRHLCAQGSGRIVLFSSVSGSLAHPHHGPYAASKGGMNQLLKVMAVEWAARGVTVNGVAPGYTESGLTAEHLARPGVRDDLTAKIPAGRLGTLDDVVGPVLFLCSEPASFVTGQVLYVDGGRTLD